MKRYSMEWIDYEDAEMAESENGEYVEYSEAQAEIEELVSMLEIYMFSGRHRRVSISTLNDTKALLAKYKHKGE